MSSARLVGVLVVLVFLSGAMTGPLLAIPTTADIEALKKVVEQNPNNVRELYRLGTYYFVNKQFEDAIQAWKRVLKTKNTDLTATSKLKIYRVLALAFYKVGKYPTAYRCIKLVYKHNPDDPKVKKLHDRILEQVTPPTPVGPSVPVTPGTVEPPKPVVVPTIDKATAKKALDEGQQMFNEAKYLLEQGNPAYEEKFTQSIKSLDVASKASPKDIDMAKALFYLGSARLFRDDDRDDDKAKAKDSLEKSLGLDRDANTLFNLGQIYGLMQMNDKEITCYEDALQMKANWAECHFRLALAYDKSKRPEAARKTFENAKAAIRLRSDYKKKFQEVLKNSEVAKMIAGIVSEIIEKSENDQLTDEETENYAKKFQDMLGDKNISPNELKEGLTNKDKMKDLLGSEKAKEFVDRAGGEDKVKDKLNKFLESKGGQKIMDRYLKKKNE